MRTPLSDPDLRALRRDLHQHPELSHHEERTAALVDRTLTALGLHTRTGIAGHGITALVEGSHPGPTLLYRADMDALPIQEAEDRPHRSLHPGVMHACGHDVHTTIGLGVASSLAHRRDDLHGRILLVFQPAEEAAPPPGQVIGAERMVDEGVLDHNPVDAAFALHVMPSLPVGAIAGTGGPVWAASDLFDIRIHGRMAHGAYPHESRDPILAAAHLVTALQQVAARNTDPRHPTVLSVCSFHGGDSHNTIPEHVQLRGLLRTLDPDARDIALERLHTIVEHTAAAHDCSATLHLVRGAHLTANHPALEAAVLERIGQAGLATPTLHPPQLGAEDFAAFSRRVPGCYLFLGVRNEERGIVHPIHTPRFDVDEDCLSIGRDAMVDALLHVGRHWNDIAPALELAPR
ncbi:MAG: amidohydrolase [Deltaproteobacteria bacterium]|nr:MAG: amidohydrolase [Deltaproteobacteria bacterium]